ncbi:SMP-30/gluconolactonase/LRE family protein [Dyadobacter chenwenxiniae]|uniref:SMP-30/gluconolactonase/LRE family protein n=1 Tax=Dyadobacter chenwenxiniae TaxID=2906456 RepID=A0A9X1TCR7_9BACT|nr:SMP-30/gluconolactonase/LRE family protein [Dyadobacter chenwenxiniae]MCF0061151.1 SMP-30/gluconolactonase/LRE family protein [Dyadobacter chenwenxiniae]UON80978.1 SMP-30/gluconolactonase/LRE family protein [Dyadobacter chenwenxiniae]
MKKSAGFCSILSGIAALLFPALLSAQIMDSKSIVAPDAQVEKLGDGYKFTEGPVADDNGNVFFTDQPNNKIIRWDAESGKFSVFSDNSGRANGMYFDNTGNLVACSDEDNQVWSFDKNGKPTVLVKDYEGKLLNGPNDLWIDPKGGIYLTDPMYKRDYWKRDPAMQQDGQHVYYLNPETKKLIRVDEKLKQPNGIIGTKDGKRLYVADIGDNKTYVYDIQNDGTLANRKLFVPKGSDGMILDAEGNLYITGKGVTVFDKTGQQIAHFPIHNGWTANLCFGGKNNDLLFITAETAVYGLKMKVKGVK